MKLLSLVPDLVNLHEQNDIKRAMFSKNLTSVPAANKKKMKLEVKFSVASERSYLVI